MKDTIEKAYEALKNAYAPYSNFHVGCAIKLKNNSFILGGNIENASYGASNCAERSALFALYSSGYTKKDIKEIAIVSDGNFITYPCGICRQVLLELVNQDTPIHIEKNGVVDTISIKDLLPKSFSGADLK